MRSKRALRKARRKENFKKFKLQDKRVEEKLQNAVQSTLPPPPPVTLPHELLEDPSFEGIVTRFLPQEEEQKESSSDSDTSEEEMSLTEEPKELSNKRKKALLRMSLADLKTVVQRPDLVDLHDSNSPDPQLLIYLKSIPNTIAMPSHWSQKKRFLAGKKGYLKSPFELPANIEATGIGRMRSVKMYGQEEKTAKQEQRERMRPKMGRLDIDYQVLHDAFFKFQTKPQMTQIGDLYYEGKEFRVHVKNKRPGILSDELRLALGMKEHSPPPWLINMQRFGPPLSYRTLRIPGLNSPIPPGCSYGYNEGEWGKPPVDQFGAPLYGDPFGVFGPYIPQRNESTEPTKFWGEVVE